MSVLALLSGLINTSTRISGTHTAHLSNAVQPQTIIGVEITLSPLIWAASQATAAGIDPALSPSVYPSQAMTALPII